VSLAYYPPYHSKYNPVERVWGVLEKDLNGQLLDSIDKVIGLAKAMKWKGKNPFVKIVD
jgi:transposase